MTHVIVTNFGVVRVSEKTLEAMDATFPGWSEPRVKGRSKKIRRYNAHAKLGKETLERVTCDIALLAWVANQDLVEI